jgi:hypothetical protein
LLYRALRDFDKSANRRRAVELIHSADVHLWPPSLGAPNISANSLRTLFNPEDHRWVLDKLLPPHELGPALREVVDNSEKVPSASYLTEYRLQRQFEGCETLEEKRAMLATLHGKKLKLWPQSLGSGYVTSLRKALGDDELTLAVFADLLSFE